MSDESGGLRALLAAALERPRRRALPMWARSVLLGLCSGGVLLVVSGPNASLVGSATTTLMQPILLLAALPSLLVVGWSIAHDWRRDRRGSWALYCRVLALALVAIALPLSGYCLRQAGNSGLSGVFFLIAGMVAPGLGVALAAGFAFGKFRRWEGMGRSAGMGCLSCVAFLLVAGVIPGIIIAIQASAPAPPDPGARFTFRALVPFVVVFTLLWVSGLSLFMAPIAGMVGADLRHGEPPRRGESWRAPRR